MAATLFGGSSQTTSKNLVEFRAGKMFMKDKTVHPDRRKGLVYVHQTDDTLMHFCWKDRTSGVVEEDLIIFPEDVEFKKVAQSPNGRVFILRFKSNNRRFFFWMQEPKSEKDEEYCRKVNEYLNNPPAQGSQRSSGSASSSLGGTDLSHLQNPDISSFIGNISQQQLMQILGSGVPNLASLLGTNSTTGSSRTSNSSSTTTSSSSTSNSTTTSTAPASSATATSAKTRSSSKPSSGRQIQLQDLQNILSGIGSAEASPRVPVDLGPAMTSEALQPILSNPEFVEKLRPYLPSTGETLPPAEQLRGTVTSPQFQQAVNLFSAALQSGELGPLISQFGLGEDAALAAASSDMEAFVKALSKKQKSDKNAKKEQKKDEDKDEDDAMALD